METEKLKQTVLVDLRSVIQSCKGGVPLNRLQNDYKGLIGATIPYTSLGYNSLECFLQSIPQVIQLKKVNGQTFVEAVADSTTVHLQSLISKQKSTKTQKCSVKRYSKKPATKQRSSFCPNSASSSRNASFTNSGGAPSHASSSASLSSNASNIKDRQEIEALKAKLAEEKEMNVRLKSKVNQLLSDDEPKLEDEYIMIQRMKYQIGMLRKQILLRHAATPQASQVYQNINEIAEKIEDLVINVEKLPYHPTKVSSPGVSNGNSLQVPKYDPFKIYQQQCKETEELKKQVQLQNSQIQSIEKRMQNQLQKLQDQIKHDSPSSPSKEKSELVEDSKNKEQGLQIQNVEKNMILEFSKLKNKVETEYFVHLVRESEKLKDFDKELKAQKKQMQNIDSRTQSQFQKLKNKVDTISIKNLADVIVKQLVSSDLINIPQVLSTSNNCELYIPPHRRPQQSTEQVPNLPVNSQTTGTAIASKKRRKKKSKLETSETITSVMKDQ